MGHRLTGLVGRLAVLQRFAGEHALEQPTALRLGFGFLPLDHHNLDSFILSRGAHIGNFTYLEPVLLELLSRFSHQGDVAYIETNYFGGIGAQSAVLFQGGRVTFGPKTSGFSRDMAKRGVVNEALFRTGVVAPGDPRDMFEAVGLDLYRSNEDLRPEREDDD